MALMSSQFILDLHTYEIHVYLCCEHGSGVQGIANNEKRIGKEMRRYAWKAMSRVSAHAYADTRVVIFLHHLIHTLGGKRALPHIGGIS